MTAINTRIFKIAFVLLVVRSASEAHPVDAAVDSVEAKAPEEASVDRYDQRQNGTENYRIQVDGLVVVVAPAEALLLAGGLAGDNDFLGIGQSGFLQEGSKPENLAPVKTKQEEDLRKPEKLEKSAHRPSLRLMNLLAPILRSVQH